MQLENSPFEVTAGPWHRTIQPPTSKSYANRLLILAARAQRQISIADLPASEDVQNLLQCLKEIGLAIVEEKNKITIFDFFPACETSSEEKDLYPGLGGTTIRFLLALLATGRRKYCLHLPPEWGQRPLQELIEGLQALGARITLSASAITVQGPIVLQEGTVTVDAERSTQFASALKMILYDSPVEVVAKEVKTSHRYLALTDFLVEQVRRGQSYFVVPPDFSSASYPLALGLTLGKAQLLRCPRIDQLQGDSVIVEIIQKMGGDIRFVGENLEVQKKENLKSFNWDCSDCLDLVPTLAYLGACAVGKTYLRHLSALRHKESDRLKEVSKLLSLFNVKQRIVENDILEIAGLAPNSGPVDYHAPPDHRMIMAAALFMKKNQGGRIFNFHHVAKSYPDFAKILEG
jgi:3-phosphoshikimate 1-carboxyvinyltransferase